MQKPLLVRTVFALLLFVLITSILYVTKLLFMPLAMAGVLALVFMPCCVWLERKGVHKLFAPIICGFLFILLMSGIILLLIWHVKNIAGSLTDIGQNFSGMMDRLQQYLHDKLGLTSSGQKELMGSPQPVGTGGIGKTV